MRKLLFLIAFLFTLPIAVNSVSAQSSFTTPGFKRISVLEERTTSVAYHAQSNGHCHMHYRTSIIITNRPSHGKLWVRRTKKRMSSKHPDRRCRGKLLHVLKVYYKPDHDYHGRDAFGYVLTGLSTDKRIGSRYFSVKVLDDD